MSSSYSLRESLASTSEFLRVPKEFIHVINSYPNGSDFSIKLYDTNGSTEIVNYHKTAELGNDLIKISRGNVRHSFSTGSKLSITPLSEKVAACGSCSNEDPKDYAQCIKNKLDHIQEVTGHEEECKTSLLKSLAREILKAVGTVISYVVQIPLAILNGILYLILGAIVLIVIGVLFLAKVIVSIYQWIRDLLLCGCPSLKCIFDLIEFVVGLFVKIFDFIVCFLLDAVNIPSKIIIKGLKHKFSKIGENYQKFYNKLHPIFCCKDEFCA
ncbi:MAG: hypothetical protein [Caudoviricetes sp.]|nr:MAG: hypothetical protein [Caudoviricetes sp.]